MEEKGLVVQASVDPANVLVQMGSNGYMLLVDGRWDPSAQSGNIKAK
jgi:hypothetical protein